MKVTKAVATTATIATFGVVGATGALMFFDLTTYGIKITHEWLGIAMIIAVVGHILANFTLFKKYLEDKKIATISAILAACAAAILVIPAKPKLPAKDIYDRVAALKLSEVQQIFNTDSDKFGIFLAKNGVEFEDISLKEFISKNKLVQVDTLNALLNK